MPKPLSINRDSLSRVREILNQLTDDTPRRWGSLTPAAMLRHLRETIDVSIGDSPCADFGNFFTKTPLVQYLITEILPWPKGGLKVPDTLLPATSATVAQERALLLQALERFVHILETDPQRTTQHSAFGMVPVSRWSRIHGRHFEHHFRQFRIWS